MRYVLQITDDEDQFVDTHVFVDNNHVAALATARDWLDRECEPPLRVGQAVRLVALISAVGSVPQAPLRHEPNAD